MLEKINLLPLKKPMSPREKKIRFWAQIISLVALGIYVVVLLSFSSSWLYLKKKNEGLDKRMENLQRQIESFRETEELQRKLVGKLEGLSEILSQRPDFQKVFTDLEKLSLEGVEIGDIRVGKEGFFEIKGTAENSFLLDDLTEAVLANGDFREATFSSVVKNKEGNLSFSLNLKRSFVP